MAHIAHVALRNRPAADGASVGAHLSGKATRMAKVYGEDSAEYAAAIAEQQERGWALTPEVPDGMEHVHDAVLAVHGRSGAHMGGLCALSWQTWHAFEATCQTPFSYAETMAVFACDGVLLHPESYKADG